MEITVKRNNLRTSPTKVRPTLYIIRGKNAKKSLDVLKFTRKGCAKDLLELLKSGVAAAKEHEMKEENLYVKTVKCDGAGMYKRHRYGSRGRVVRIMKRNSHISLTLSDEISTQNNSSNPEVAKPAIERKNDQIVRPKRKQVISSK